MDMILQKSSYKWTTYSIHK